MKNLTVKQIEEVKSIKSWTRPERLRSLKKSEVQMIKEIKLQREIAQQPTGRKNDIEMTKECINWSLECKGTGYFKTIILGNTGIYYASATYGHSDYNKSRLFDITPKTLRLMEIFNAVVNK